MKFLPNKINGHLKTAHNYGRYHIRRRPYIVPILGLLAGVAIMGGVIISRPSAVLRPSDSHVVFLSDNGQSETLDTKAKTVGDLVTKLPLHLIPQDVVEPALDTKIVQDNFRVNIYRARPVTVIDNGVKIVTITAQKSPRVVAADAGLTIYPEDDVSFEPGNVAQNIIGEEVVVKPATPVQFDLYGTELSVRTQAKTVGALLAEKDVKPTTKDTVRPALDTPVTANMQVEVIRNGTATVTEQQSIPAPVQIVADPDLTLGAQAVRQEGTPGLEAITYKVVTQNGREVSRTPIQTAIISKPVPKIVVQGTNVDISGAKTALMASAGIAPGDYGYADYIISHESGWCPTKWQGEVGYCPAYHGAPTVSYIGYGLCQATPGYKMASAGGDWATNPITQLRWCNSYASADYGSWYSAYLHWVANSNW